MCRLSERERNGVRFCLTLFAAAVLATGLAVQFAVLSPRYALEGVRRTCVITQFQDESKSFNFTFSANQCLEPKVIIPGCNVATNECGSSCTTGVPCCAIAPDYLNCTVWSEYRGTQVCARRYEGSVTLKLINSSFDYLPPRTFQWTCALDSTCYNEHVSRFGNGQQATPCYLTTGSTGIELVYNRARTVDLVSYFLLWLCVAFLLGAAFITLCCAETEVRSNKVPPVRLSQLVVFAVRSGPSGGIQPQ